MTNWICGLCGKKFSDWGELEKHKCEPNKKVIE